MTLGFIIENDRLVYKSDDTDWQREATVGEYDAFQFGIQRGRELVANEVKKKIMELKVWCYPEHPLSPTREPVSPQKALGGKE